MYDMSLLTLLSPILQGLAVGFVLLRVESLAEAEEA
jgi:hypothetical protein